MNQGEVLMREILENPDDDAPRVVYADWLLANHTDEESHARAALIHAQCALETATPGERPALQARAHAVLERWKRRWTAEFRRADLDGRWKFRRGFLDSGTLSARVFFKHAGTIFEHAPLLRAMTFPEASNELIDLAGSPYLARLVDVDLAEMCRCGRCKIYLELPHLFESPHVTGLRRLVLRGCRIDGDNATRLGASSRLHALRELDVSANKIDAGSVGEVARLPALRVLSLAGNPIGDDGAHALAMADLRLERLDLSDTQLGEAAARALADSPWADSLRVLDLRRNRLGAGAARKALRARFGTRLRL